MELFVGEPLFPHEGDKDDVLEAMVKLMGDVPPEHMLEEGKRTNDFFQQKQTWLHAFRKLFWPQRAVYRLRWLRFEAKTCRNLMTNSPEVHRFSVIFNDFQGISRDFSSKRSLSAVGLAPPAAWRLRR